jgi:GT2 family glycosyltransferase
MADLWKEMGENARSAFAWGAPIVRSAWTKKVCERAGLAGELGAAASREFDFEHYSRVAKRSFASREGALFHYLMIGSRKDWEPQSGFSPHRYLRTNPDVLFAKYEPFAHYCRFGQYEGREEMSSGASSTLGDHDPPSVAEMLSRPRPSKREPFVDVVIPVFGNRALTLRAIDSVLRTRSDLPFDLIIIDDASPDRELARDLKELANAKLITLMVNERNLGFVHSANRGLRFHQNRDVVLLNSDTCVYSNWLARLMDALTAATDVGTATPLSNAATILSYPIRLRDNAMGQSEAESVDNICQALDLSPIDIPTAVGFCMAIRRVCLDQVGFFDEDNFGRGYGEENDFCMRASAKGWRHVAATNVLVWHRGGGTFGPERDSRIQHAQDVLQRLHPDYHAKIHAFIERDPLSGIRAKLDSARVAFDRRPKVLQLGGTGGDGRRPSESEAEVEVRLVPDFGPYYGQRRIAIAQRPHLLNFCRLHDHSREEDLARFLVDLGIQKVEIAARSDWASPLDERLAEQGKRRRLKSIVRKASGT